MPIRSTVESGLVFLFPQFVCTIANMKDRHKSLLMLSRRLRSQRWQTVLKSVCGGNRALPSLLCITVFGDDKSGSHRLSFLKPSIYTRTHLSVLHELLDIAHLMSTFVASCAGGCHRRASGSLAKKRFHPPQRSFMRSLIQHHVC